MIEAAQKVTASHLKRNAYLYVRQSTLHQVLENTESTERQYALRRRAVALGWPPEQIVVIDHDRAQSGASASDRVGFQRLVAEVGLGKAGIVMGLEVSRLARNCADWHRLLEICGLTHTLILDEDGLYDPGQYNDRLLLGLKGTMSEAELHILKARMLGGMINKAQRGELKLPLPVGLVYDDDERVNLDPDQQVQQSIRCLFDTFRRLGSAVATMRAFHEQGLRFPRRRCGRISRSCSGANSLTVTCCASSTIRATQGLSCPGASATIARPEAGGRHELPQDQWQTVLRDAHPGYITWEQYQEKLQRLRENEQVRGEEQQTPPREGPALLQGLVVCGAAGIR